MTSTVRAQPLFADAPLPTAAANGSTRYVAALLLFVCGHHWLLCALQIAGIQRETLTPVGAALRVLPGLVYGEGHAYALPFSGSGTEA